MTIYSSRELATIQEYVAMKSREYQAKGLIPTLDLLLDDLASQLPPPDEEN